MIVKKKMIQSFMWFLNVKTAIMTLCEKMTLKNWILKQWQVIKLSATYHLPNKTSLYLFNEAICNNKKVLKKYFWGDEELAFANLYDEFSKLSNNSNYYTVIENIKLELVLMLKIIQLRYALLMPIKYKDEIKRLTQTTDIKRAEGILKLWIVELENSKKQNKETSNNNGFDELRIKISKYMSYPIDDKKITVKDFALMVASYKKEIEIQQKQLNDKNG